MFAALQSTPFDDSDFEDGALKLKPVKPSKSFFEMTCTLDLPNPT